MSSLQGHQVGAWQQLTPHGRVGGIWQQIRFVYARIGGVWQTIWVLFSPTTNTYTATGPGTETIPAGAAQVIIEVKAGGAGSSQAGYTDAYANGGGGGAYSRSVYSLTSANWGQTIPYQVGKAGTANLNNNGLLGGNSTAGGGTFSMTAMTANGGTGAGTGTGAGGTATGGNQVNATGASGVNGGAGGVSGSAGVYFDTGNAYGHGGSFGGSDATNGFVSFHYT